MMKSNKVNPSYVHSALSGATETIAPDLVMEKCKSQGRLPENSKSLHNYFFQHFVGNDFDLIIPVFSEFVFYSTSKK